MQGPRSFIILSTNIYRGEIKMFKNKDGSLTVRLKDRREARRRRAHLYDPLQKCETCKVNSIRFTHTGACIHCARLDAVVWYLKQIDVRGTLPPLSSLECILMKAKYWVRPQMCSKAGHVGMMTRSGLCYNCENGPKIKSPRQIAIQEGGAWYLPENPCKNCGGRDYKRVANGVCRGCQKAGHDGRSTPDSKLVRDWPNLILPKDVALLQGIKVYRTGAMCNRKHRGYRYVVTDSCIPCLDYVHSKRHEPKKY